MSRLKAQFKYASLKESEAKVPNTRKANESNSKNILDRRNDELTRQMSHTTDLVEWDGHSGWLVCLITHKSEQIACDVCENENTNEKVAIVRLDSEGERALISINLSPKMRGQRKTKGCLRDAISFFKTIYSNVRFIDAEIKSINITSQQSFLDVGFVFVKEDADVSFYEHVV